MGYVKHHAIVVTSWDGAKLAEAHQAARRLCRNVSEISEEGVNGYASFFVPPDGSKEGWGESNAGDASRDELTAWLDKQREGDGSSALEWVEIAFGSDDADASVHRHAWNTQAWLTSECGEGGKAMRQRGS